MAVVPMNVGFGEMAKHATGTGSPAAFTRIALGEGSTTVTAGNTVVETELTDSGLARTVADTISTVTTSETDDTLNLSHVFTATATKTVRVAGVLNQASTGDLLMAGNLIPEAPMVNGDTLTLTLKCQFRAVT